MLKKEQDKKTAILSVVPGRDHDTSSLIEEQHRALSRGTKAKGHKSGVFVKAILAAVVLSAAAFCAYVLYEQKNQHVLTGELRASLNQGRLKQAQGIMSEIEKHGYASESISVLGKQLSDMKKLDDAWNKVQRYYDLGRYADARTALAPFTENTEYHDRAEVLLGDIRTRELQGMLKAAESLYAQGDADKASALIRHVLELDPLNPDAKTLLPMLKPAVPVRRAMTHAAAVKSSAENSGDSAYRRGDFDAAVRFWTDAQNKNDAKKIAIAANIKKYFSIGKKAFESRDYAGAIKSFDKVQAFVTLLGIRGSADEKKVQRYYSLSYGLLGKQAFADGRYHRANVCFRESLKFDPDNAEAARGFSALNNKAERLYKTAYMISGANMPEACRLYNQALDMAQKDTDVYKKIKERFIVCKP
ncbi:MAG: hypothetical protein M1591_08315 [Deltaproteobacteria bacterium]|nr:hypothetical protein [Deltaproteobacteria bacterium]